MANPNPIPTTTPSSVPARLLYRVRLKDKHDIREVIVAARDLDTANRVGEAYCSREKYRFIRVENMVVADEEILKG